jgi:hypothetical protein
MGIGEGKEIQAKCIENISNKIMEVILPKHGKEMAILGGF